MQGYSLDLRQRVLADCDAGLKTRAVAEKYGVSRTWVRALKQRRRETNEIAARRSGGGRKPNFDRARLAELVAEDADATLAELRARFGVQCALSAIWKALDQLRITFKKSAAGRRTRPPRRCGAPRGLADHATQARPHAAVFIDETWATTNMTRLRGRAPRGTRVVTAVPHGHWKTTTLIAALDCRGIRASMALDGAVNRLAFEAFVRRSRAALRGLLFIRGGSPLTRSLRRFDFEDD
jgi:transposase